MTMTAFVLTGHALDLEPALLLDVEDKHPDVGAGSDKVKSWQIVFIPLEEAFLGLLLQSVDGLVEDLGALGHAPDLLIGQSHVSGLSHVGAGGKVVPLQGRRRLSVLTVLPEILHGQKVLDVSTEQLGEDLLCVVVILLGPDPGALPLHVPVLLGLSLLLLLISVVVAVTLGRGLGILSVRGHVLVRVGLPEQLIEQVLECKQNVNKTEVF